MNFSVTIAVYENFETLGSAVRRLQTAGLPDHQVSLVTHDVQAEVPDPAAVEGSHQSNVVRDSSSSGASTLTPIATSSKEERAASPIVGKLGSFLNQFAGEFFAQLRERFHGNEEIAHSITDYQSLVAGGHLLLVFTGSTADVERAAKTLAETNAQQINIHYAS